MKIMAPREQINLKVLDHEKLMQCCADIQHTRLCVWEVISKCTIGEWVCVGYESFEFYEKREAIQKAIGMIRGLCDALLKRAAGKSKTYDSIHSSLQKIIDLLDSFD